MAATNNISISINNAAINWQTGMRCRTKVTEAFVRKHVGKNTEALSAEEAEQVLSTHAKDKEDSANFDNLLEAKVTRQADILTDAVKNNKLHVVEIAVGDNVTDEEERNSMEFWFKCFILGMLPGLNESGFMVAGERYSRDTTTIYSTVTQDKMCVFNDIETVEYDPSVKPKAPECYFSEEAQYKAMVQVKKQLNPVIQYNEDGHWQLKMLGHVVRKFVTRTLVDGSSKKVTTLDVSAFIEDKPQADSQETE